MIVYEAIYAVCVMLFERLRRMSFWIVKNETQHLTQNSH